jgi:oxygen-dependent protoporphyrinogen oxidase
MIAIVGAGISGLAAAYELAIRDVPFVVLEKSTRAGGLIWTERVRGYTIEAGADSMLAQKRAAFDLCSEVGLSGEIIAACQPRTAFVLHRGRLYPLPTPSAFGIPLTWGGLLRFRLLSPLGRLRLGLEPLMPREPAEEETIGEFFRRRFGRQAAERLAQPLLGGIHAGDIDTLSMRTLAARLASVEGRGSVLRWLRRHAIVDPNGAFRSLSRGMGQLVEAIVKRLPAGSLRLGCEATSIAPGWRLDTSEGPVDCQAVIIAAPAHAAARLFEGVDREAASLCAQTAYVSTASVALGFPREAVGHPLAGSGFVVVRASNPLRMTACTWVSSKFEGRAPAGKVLLRAFFGGAHDTGAVDLSDEELIDASIRELSKVLSIAGEPELARVYRWRDAGAQHDVTHASRVASIQRRLSSHRGLHVCGSGFKVVGVPDCISDGRRTAIAAIDHL